MVAPLFERQQAFNSALVDHVNRNVAMHRETTRALETHDCDASARIISGSSSIRRCSILYTQQITPVRRHEGSARRWPDAWTGRGPQRARRRDAEALGVDGGARAALRCAGERRADDAERHAARGADAEAGARDGATGATGCARVRRVRQVPTCDECDRCGAATPLDSYKYVGFEDQFRGSQHDIRERVAAYVPLFEGASDVLDVGCGRGEFLDLLRAAGISARGIDLNDEMAAVCRERGLDATAGDALSYLLSLPDGSLGGLFAAQVVEHLEPDYLMRFLDAAYHKLRPGSKIVLETINPACWYRVLLELHPRHHACAAAASGHAAVSRRRQRFPERLDPVYRPFPGRDEVAESSGRTGSAWRHRDRPQRECCQAE